MANIANAANTGWQYIEKDRLLKTLFEEEFTEDEAMKYSHSFRPLKLNYQLWLALAVLKFRRNGIKSHNEIPFLNDLYLSITGQKEKDDGEEKPSTPQNHIKRLISKFI